MGGERGRISGRWRVGCPAGAHPVPQADLDYKSRRRGCLRIGAVDIPKPYVLLTNRHYPQKRFDYAVRALAKNRDLVLVVTGARTAYTQQMEALARRLG